jgi:hypothetical protein
MAVVAATGKVNLGYSEINYTRDAVTNATYLKSGTVDSARLPTVPITKGGTGATTAAAARTALGVPATAHVHAAADITSGTLALARIPNHNHDAVNITTGTLDAARLPSPLAATTAASASTAARLDSASGQCYFDGSAWIMNKVLGTLGLSISGDETITGHIYAPNMAPVTSGYVAMYRNGDGRLGVTPSSIRYKSHVVDYEGSILDLRPVTYVLKADERKTVRLGLIAEEANDVEPMLVVHEDGETESIKYELLAVALLKEVQRLAARVDALEARL